MMKSFGIKGFLYGWMLLVMGVLVPVLKVHAGGINQYEAQVIAAASGTFTYEGKQYRAGSAYINQLEAYLAQDDVDLTSEQAAEAVSMMYANVAEGIAQGYLYEVQDGNTGEAAEDTQEDSQKAGDELETGEKEQPDDNEDKKNTDQPAEASGESVWEAMANPTETKQKLKKRPSRDKASAVVVLGESGIAVSTGDGETFDVSTEAPAVLRRLCLEVRWIGIALLVVTFACGVILWVKKCMSFRRTKHRRIRPGHSKRRKIRRYMRNILTVTTAAALFGSLLFFAFYVALFRDEAVMQCMQGSGYFRYAYTEYIAETAGDGEKNVSFEEKNYEQYLSMIKKDTLQVLENGAKDAVSDSNIAPYIYHLRKGLKELFRDGGFCMPVSALLGILLMVFMDQRRERGVRHIAAAQLAASGILLVLTAVFVIGKPYLYIYMEPDYLYLFAVEYIAWCGKVMTSVTAFGVVFGMILVGIYRTLRKESAEG